MLLRYSLRYARVREAVLGRNVNCSTQVLGARVVETGGGGVSTAPTFSESSMFH